MLRQLGISDALQANELPSNMILSLLRLGDHLAAVPRYVLKNTDLAGELVQIAGDVPPVVLGHAAIRTERVASGPVDRFIASIQAQLAGFDGA